ncbi:MAG: kdpC [Acidimicrobiales bacterium]|nr:kdpC [Acidimicrobiales bacterium]
MRRQLLPAIRMLLVITVIGGLLYPLAMTGVAQALFRHQANGSLVTDASGRVVGSSLLGQPFTGPTWFLPRPSAAGNGYDGTASGASNLGPTNPDLLKAVQERAVAYRTENGLSAAAMVPVDAVTSSGSGLDPHISLANARLQAPRVARARGMAVTAVRSLIDRATDGRSLGFLGEPGVNVLRLNLLLERGK